MIHWCCKVLVMMVDGIESGALNSISSLGRLYVKTADQLKILLVYRIDIPYFLTSKLTLLSYQHRHGDQPNE